MYISSLRKSRFNLPPKAILVFGTVIVLFLCSMLRFVTVAAPFAENKARYLAIDIINSGVSNYLRENQEAFSDIITVTGTPPNTATVDTGKLNLIKAELTGQINNALAKDTAYTVNVPLANYLGLPFLSGIGTPVKLKMHPVSRVLIDFEKDFSSAGINQTHLSLNLNVKVTVLVVIPGMRRSVTVETDIPAGDAIFLGEVPDYYASGGNLPAVTFGADDKN